MNKRAIFLTVMFTLSAGAAWAEKPQTQPATQSATQPAISPATQPAVDIPKGARVTADGWFAAVKPGEKKPTLSKEITRAAVIPIREAISGKTFKAIRRKVLAATAQNPQIVIFDMDTYGGEVISAIEITRLIKAHMQDVYTVCYVRTHAISAGAAIAMSCDEIVMAPYGKFGDCAPIVMGGKLEGVEREKIETVLRSEFEESAEKNGYNVPLSTSMVSSDEEVWLIRSIKTRELRYVLSTDFEGKVRTDDKDVKKEWEKLSIVVPKGKLLTLTPEKAQEYGFVRRICNFTDDAPYAELAKSYGITCTLSPMADTWSENLVDFLTSPVIMGILVFMMLMFGYIEMHTPGFGLFGGISLACLLLLVGSQYLTGLAMWWEIAVFFIGIILLAMEIFVIPGFGVAGIAGIICIVVGGLAMLIPNEPGELPWPTGEAWNTFINNLAGVAAGVVLFFIGAMILAKYLPESKLLARLLIILRREPADEIPPVGDDAPILKIHPGEVGVALSILRPAGRAQFGDIITSVVSEGTFIQPGSQIRVISCDGNRIMVAAQEEGK